MHRCSETYGCSRCVVDAYRQGEFPCGCRRRGINTRGRVGPTVALNQLFWKENKEGAGTSPAPLGKLLSLGGLATSGARLLRRRLLRGGRLALRWFLPSCYCHDVPPIGLAGCKFT